MKFYQHPANLLLLDPIEKHKKIYSGWHLLLFSAAWVQAWAYYTMAQMVSNLLPIQEIQVLFLGRESPMEEEKETHYSILPGGTPGHRSPQGRLTKGHRVNMTKPLNATLSWKHEASSSCLSLYFRQVFQLSIPPEFSIKLLNWERLSFCLQIDITGCKVCCACKVHQFIKSCLTYDLYGL